MKAACWRPPYCAMGSSENLLDDSFPIPEFLAEEGLIGPRLSQRRAGKPEIARPIKVVLLKGLQVFLFVFAVDSNEVSCHANLLSLAMRMGRQEGKARELIRI